MPSDHSLCVEKIALRRAPCHPGLMKIAETVIFGGSGLDRAAEMRGKSEALKAQQAARAILLWRGKPMISGDDLMRVPLDHTVMADASPAMIFLGREKDAPVFAADLSAWTPADLTLKRSTAFLTRPSSDTPHFPMPLSLNCAQS